MPGWPRSVAPPGTGTRLRLSRRNFLHPAVVPQHFPGGSSAGWSGNSQSIACSCVQATSASLVLFPDLPRTADSINPQNPRLQGFFPGECGPAAPLCSSRGSGLSPGASPQRLSEGGRRRSRDEVQGRCSRFLQLHHGLVLSQKTKKFLTPRRFLSSRECPFHFPTSFLIPAPKAASSRPGVLGSAFVFWDDLGPSVRVQGRLVEPNPKIWGFPRENSRL